MQSEHEHLTSSSSISDTDQNSDHDSSDNFSDVVPSRAAVRRGILTGTEALVPPDILKRPKLVSLATRMNLTSAQQASFIKAIVEECQGDTNKVTLFYATADRSRRAVNAEIATAVRGSWIPPGFIALGF